MKIFKVTLKATNGLRDTAQGKDGKYLEVENGTIYVLEKDIDYIFKTYDVEILEYAGLFFERSKQNMEQWLREPLQKSEDII